MNDTKLQATYQIYCQSQHGTLPSASGAAQPYELPGTQPENQPSARLTQRPAALVWRLLPRSARGVLSVATLCVGWMCMFAAHSQTQTSVQVVDDRGVAIRFAAPPQRIVSLLPSLSEAVCALDVCERLVGVDRYSNFPASLQALPQLGGGLDPNLEAIVALKPDVVLMARTPRFSERLQSLGLKVVELEPKTHADVQRVLLALGTLLAVPDAQRVWRTIDAGVAAAAQSVPASLHGTRVYFEVNEGPYAAGESSFIGQTLSRLGVKNTVPAKLGPFPLLNPEFVVRANPDVILIGQRSADTLAARPGWSSMAALRAGRVCTFSAEEGDVLVRPGPRMAQAARLMAACIVSKAPGVANKAHGGAAAP